MPSRSIDSALDVNPSHDRPYGQFPFDSFCSEALKLRPDFALAANNLGFVFFKQQKYKEAARWFENTLKIDPSRAIAYRNLGDACVKSDDKDCARKAFKTYLELAPTGSGAEYVKQELGKL
ncbi:MAG: polysaccharide deacetylase [Rhodocyclales bacterium]|nr:polysaccharide deacetylase [Rhodocyclales bacterium]